MFALKYDCRLPAIPSLIAKHCRSMTFQSKYLKYVFPEPPLTAFKRQNNIRGMVIKAKVPEPVKLHESRQLNGMKKCGKFCKACPFIEEGKLVKN